MQEAIALVKRDAETVTRAAAFFIEQVFLFPEADSYRVLGARPDASTVELRQHMAVLLKWLHPDTENSGERAVLAHRVTQAWQDLKTEEKRAEYDLRQQSSARRSGKFDLKGRLTGAGSLRSSTKKTVGNPKPVQRIRKLRRAGIVQRALRYILSPSTDRN